MISNAIRTLDRHALYELAVQTPDHDVELLDQLYRARRRRAPRTLREDFCGTARLSVAWVASDDEREAVAIDYDAEVLARARRHVRTELDEDERSRIELVRDDVRAPSTRTFDLVLAPNFSWACFHGRDELVAYLEGARSALEGDGLFALEMFGGRDLERTIVHRHAREGFTYVWEHRTHDAATEITDARIHFELDDGRRVDDAFRYVYRVWRANDVLALLREVGFAHVELVVESAEGELEVCSSAPEVDAWNGYLIADPRRASRRRRVGASGR